MTLDERHVTKHSELENILRNERGAFFASTLTEDEREYAPWYARLLSTLTLLTLDEDIVFACGSKSYDDPRVEILVFTAGYLIVVEVPDVTSEDNPTPVVLPRAGLTELRVKASSRIDAQGSAKLTWPGNLHFQLTYDGHGSVEFDAPGYDRYDRDKPAPALVLLDGLRGDLLKR